MKARVTVDVWFDVDNWTEEQVKEVVEDAIDSYNGSADVKEVKLVPDEDDEVPTHFIIGYLDYADVTCGIVAEGRDVAGRWFDIVTPSDSVARVYWSSRLVSDIEIH